MGFGPEVNRYMKATRILKKLNYLPRWAWYLASLSIGGPIGPLFVYLGFHALGKMAKDEEEEENSDFGRTARSRRYSPTAAYEDEECFVTGEGDVEREWARTEASARQAKGDTPDSAPGDSGDIAEIVREVEDSIRRIRIANDLIPDPALSAQIDSIEESCSAILSILRQRPQLLPQLRTFLRYYLPTTLKLLDARARLDRAQTPKAREVRARISEALGVIDAAFKKQTEALDEYRFIDLESEMDVLRDMLRADGLAGEENGGTPLSAH